ncbi:MAG TPA: hypothetical protein VNU95_11510, partial [Candidatus Acidoferrales bacterium]|nr:hypothetical protein [Candidatus Acidoferrales bacterium]
TTAELQKLPQNGANKLPANQLKKIEKDLETALGAIQNAIPAATNAASRRNQFIFGILMQRQIFIWPQVF